MDRISPYLQSHQVESFLLSLQSCPVSLFVDGGPLQDSVHLWLLRSVIGLKTRGRRAVPPPFHPASAAGCADPDVSAYQRYNKESGVYLQSPNLLTIAASATVGM